MTPYLPLEVIETRNRIAGRQFYVRDEEGAWFWLVEYIDSRLQCFCDDGEAHSEAPEVERPCVHLDAVVAHRMAEQQSSRPHGVIRPAAFVD